MKICPVMTLPPLRLCSNMTFPILKRVVICCYFLDFPFDCIHTGTAAMKYPFTQTVDAVSCDYH